MNLCKILLYYNGLTTPRRMLPLNNTYLNPKTSAYVLPQIHLKVKRGV